MLITRFIFHCNLFLLLLQLQAILINELIKNN